MSCDDMTEGWDSGVQMSVTVRTLNAFGAVMQVNSPPPTHCVLSLEFQLVNSQGLSVLQLLNLLHLLVVSPDLLHDEHLHTPVCKQAVVSKLRYIFKKK